MAELRKKLNQKEQELLREADEFEEHNTKKVDHLLRLANGRAMNLSEHIQTIKEALVGMDHRQACEFYSKKYTEIHESNDTELPQLENISYQAQNKFQVKSQSINEILEKLQNFKLNVGSLNLQMNSLQDISNRRENFGEQRGKDTSNLPSNLYELGYKGNGSKPSVLKTMNKIKENFDPDSDFKKDQFYDPRPTRGPSFKNQSNNSLQRE